jgi:hypothetical protein
MWQDVGDHDDAGRDLAGQQILHDGRRGRRRGAAKAAPDPRRQSGSSRPGKRRRIGRLLAARVRSGTFLLARIMAMCARSALALSSLRSARSSSDIFHLSFGMRAAGQLEVRQLHDFRGGRLVKLEQALSALSRMSRAGFCSRFKAFLSQEGGQKSPRSIATKRHHRGKGPPELQVPGGPSSRYATLTEHHFRTGSRRRLFPIERARETALRERRGQEWRDRQTVSPAPRNA